SNIIFLSALQLFYCYLGVIARFESGQGPHNMVGKHIKCFTPPLTVRRGEIEC
ncbi:hypothetical protein PDJAM_G00008500, partial [Pangasius djambal]|nr:hypothetical protein [Pangasius djambal]